MKIEISDNYDLPDRNLLRSGNTLSGLMVWIPDRTMVIIGKGSVAEEELIFENIMSDQVPVVRRGTGGCSVVLSPDMAVVSFALKNDADKKNNQYFEFFNSLVIKALRQQNIENLETNGISDITLNDLKIAGSAIFRNKDRVFYHVILNLNGNADFLEKYLKIPKRQPKYRQNRSHKDFVTSFKAQGYDVDLEFLEKSLKSDWLFYQNG